MKRGYSKLIPAVLLTVLAIVLVSGSSTGETIFVDDDDGPWADYNTIQSAIENATAGDTILVFNGSYSEEVEIDKQLYLMGNGSDQTILDIGTGFGNVVTITAPGCTFSDFMVTGAPYLGKGIDCEANDTTITDNLLVDNDYGIRLDNVFNCVVTGNTIMEGDYTAIYIFDSDDNTVVDNVCINHSDDGLYISLSDNNNISGNNISSNGAYGISMALSDDNMFILNEVAGNVDGPLEMDQYCDDNVFINSSVALIGPIAGDVLGEPGENLRLRDYCTIYSKKELTWSWDYNASDGITEESTSENPVWLSHDIGSFVITLTTTDEDDLVTSDDIMVHIAEEIYAEDDDLDDVMDEDDKVVGGYPEIDIVQFTALTSGEHLFLEIEIDGTMNVSSGDDLNAFMVYMFPSGTKDLTDFDNAVYVATAMMDTAMIMDQVADDIDTISYAIPEDDEVVIVVPLSSIGDTTNYEMNAAGLRMINYDPWFSSYDEGYIDVTTEPKAGGDGGGSSPGMEMVFVVAAIAVVVLVRKRRN